jgi:hypothetical protein
MRTGIALYTLPAALALALAAAALGGQDPRKEQLKTQLKDEIVGAWIYDDIPAGFAEAKKSGKPMLVVFR